MNKSQATQIEKYGGEEGYRAEMRRRRGLVKKYAFKDDPKLAKQAINKRWAEENGNKQTSNSQDSA